jgi:hypothetical protein
MGNSSGSFKARGALLECFKEYPQFREDLEVLVAEGYVKVTGPETCKWTKSKTSLADYFKWTGYDAEGVIGGFWAPIARCFGENQRSLSKLASNNANPLKKKYSKAFLKIKPILEKYRKKAETRDTERQIYNYIKKLILFAEDEEPETIHEIVHKIGMICLKNVDKNLHKRRSKLSGVLSSSICISFGLNFSKPKGRRTLYPQSIPYVNYTEKPIWIKGI